MAAMYAVYHGPDGLRKIAQRTHGLAAIFAEGLRRMEGCHVSNSPFFDTVKVTLAENGAAALIAAAKERGVNMRLLKGDNSTVRSLSLFLVR